MADNPLLISNSDISGNLKNVYEQYRIKCFPILTPLLAQIKKAGPGGPENMQWGGNGVFWDVSLTRPVGFTASDSGFFPPTAQAIERQAFLGIKRTYINRQIDALAIQGTQSRDAAFVPLARKIMDEAMDAARLGQQTALMGDGRGIYAIVGTVNSTTNITVSSPYGLAGAGRGGLLLDQGQYVAVLDTTGATIRGRATISTMTISGDNAVLVLDTAIAGMVSTDLVVPATTQDTSFNQFPFGLINTLNRGAGFNNFESINAATFPRWDALRMVAGTDTADVAQPSEMDVYDMILRVAGRSGKNAQTTPNEFLLLTTPGVAKKLGESFLGQRKWDMVPRVTLNGGFSAIQVCGLPVVTDSWCPAGTIYLIHKPSLTWIDRQDWMKLQYEDSGPWRFLQGRDAYEVNFGSYWNFGCLQRNTHAMITGYTDTVRYDHTV